MAHPFEEFLKDFIPKYEEKSKQLNQALWILEITGLQDAANLRASLSTELKMLFNNKEIFEKIQEWEKTLPTDPLLKRQLMILKRAFQESMMPAEILKKISLKEAEIAQAYACFRPLLDGKSMSENEIREILKKENNPEKRKKAFEASKEIGEKLAPLIKELVQLRNQGAKAIGFSDYFQLQLYLQEVDSDWLFKTLDDLFSKSDQAHQKMMSSLEEQLAKRFGVSKEELGPWAWSEPFSQEDPQAAHILDDLVKDVDILKSSQDFFQKMGFDVSDILKRSDLYEKEGKNQHAFCINIDRYQDVRTLNNIRPSIQWLETILHELGHAVYELGFSKDLPWLLRAPPHMIPTEAMALICGRQAYLSQFLNDVVQNSDELIQKAEESLKRRQLIFSRWVLVMTYFEKEMYRDPHQDLNQLWWDLVKKYQKISPPKGRESKNDWAAKYHVGLAPVYYFSYLLGEMFASSLQEKIKEKTSKKMLHQKKAGEFLKEQLFHQGAQLSWDQLIEHSIGESLSCDAWVNEFANNS